MDDVAFRPEENRNVERSRGRKQKLIQEKVSLKKRQLKPPQNDVSKMYILVIYHKIHIYQKIKIHF